MRSRWNDDQASAFVRRHAADCGEALAWRTYSARLLGDDPALVLHGGGNTSVKDWSADVFGQPRPVLFVKASGFSMARLDVRSGHLPLDLGYLQRLRSLAALDDESMRAELHTHLLRPSALQPSIETLVHAFLPPRYIDHTHADAILALTNQPDGPRLVREALGDRVIVLDYVMPGFPLAKAAADAFEAQPDAVGMVWARHGVTTWGETAREAYDAMIALVSRAEAFIAARVTRPVSVAGPAAMAAAAERFELAAPSLRRLLSPTTGDPDHPHRRVVLLPLATPDVLASLEHPGARELVVSAPLTSDHLIRTGPFPAWIDTPDFANPDHLLEQLDAGIAAHSERYSAYVERHSASMPGGLRPFDARPRVVLLPGLGAVCAGADLDSAIVVRDIAAHTLAVKSTVAAFGSYEGLPEGDLFEMEYRTLQHAKLDGRRSQPLSGTIALVTGAAGAIGSGICRALLDQGALVAATDLPGAALDGLAAELSQSFGERILGVPLDVTDPDSVRNGFGTVIRTWGGVDLVVVNAGIAHVSALELMSLDAFRRLERVNVEGTLLVLAECARRFRAQGLGGDIVMVSTKNVFAPGAKFGAYSATKAAAHQLARIASLEMADLGVRVNMVSPDAVFSDGARKSGLWAEVGPDRMRARGLDEAGLEAYYRSRNLLKVGVTARHVANAVLYFATRQSPTTGATIPVDGGLPDATPR